jgi:hypothetical protein
MRMDKFMMAGMTFAEASVARKAEREANAKARAAKMAEGIANGTLTHCQICARLIQSKKGVIAHHGYKRPGDGWQTASCYGARHLPWEKSCAIIPLCIKHVESYITHRVAGLADFNTNPPAVLTRTDWNRREVEVAKPADFMAQEKSPGSFRPHSYESLFYRSRTSQERSITQAKADVVALTARFAEWHKLHPECEGDTL